MKRSKQITQRCGAHLRQIRENAGFSRAQVATKCDRSKSLLARVERGERRIEVVDFMDFCGAVGKDPAEAMGELVAAGLFEVAR